jgi:hypothetical protein
VNGRKTKVAAIALVIVVASCSGWPLTPPVPSQAAPAPLDDPECYGMTETADGPPRTIEFLLDYADRVVVAEVSDILPGVWNTIDGRRPNREPGDRFPAGIVTPHRLTISRVLSGPADTTAITVVKEGGEADCVVHDVYPVVRVEKQRRYVFFLQPGRDANGNRHPERPAILEAWAVNASDELMTAEDGQLTLAELAERISRSGD